MRIGLDLGGTKIEAVAFDATGATRARRRVATPRDDYAATLRAIAGLVEEVERETGERGTVGIGMPGAISPATGLVKNTVDVDNSSLTSISGYDLYGRQTSLSEAGGAQTSSTMFDDVNAKVLQPGNHEAPLFQQHRRRHCASNVVRHCRLLLDEGQEFFVGEDDY